MLELRTQRKSPISNRHNEGAFFFIQDSTIRRIASNSTTYGAFVDCRAFSLSSISTIHPIESNSNDELPCLVSRALRCAQEKPNAKTSTPITANF
jgi:hypothetical protein